jgi:hypothetical protein
VQAGASADGPTAFPTLNYPQNSNNLGAEVFDTTDLSILCNFYLKDFPSDKYLVSYTRSALRKAFGSEGKVILWCDFD